jgi:hypothetical protein
MWRKNLIRLAAIVTIGWLPPVSASPLDDRIAGVAELDAGCAKSNIASPPEKKELFCACMAGSLETIEGILQAKMRKPNSADLNENGEQIMSVILKICQSKYK